MNKCLNIGSDRWKLPNFINIDLNPEVDPDLILDLNNLAQHFGNNSVDFIYAGHVFEHFEYEESLRIIRHCHFVLKPFRTLLTVVPDWRKAQIESDELADRIIMGEGDHKMLMSAERLRHMLKQAGFTVVQEISNLIEIPYIIVADTSNPKVDEWQSAFLALKI